MRAGPASLAVADSGCQVTDTSIKTPIAFAYRLFLSGYPLGKLVLGWGIVSGQ